MAELIVSIKIYGEVHIGCYPKYTEMTNLNIDVKYFVLVNY